MGVLNENSKYEMALGAARLGFYVFPLVPGSKFPVSRFGISGNKGESYRDFATRDECLIKSLWIDPLLEHSLDYDVGICTDIFFDESTNKVCALVVVDLDVDKDKGINGIERVKQGDFPKLSKTAYQKTPRGGVHLVYKHDTPLKQGSAIWGKGTDVRSNGGLIRLYDLANLANPKPCPKGIVDALAPPTVAKFDLSPRALNLVENGSNVKRAERYLRQAPIAVSGSGGDAQTFQVAAKLRDFGLDELTAVATMLRVYNPRCAPPWEEHEIVSKVRNAYQYGKNKVGVDNPQNYFPMVAKESNPKAREKHDAVPRETVDEGDDEDPILRFNKEYALVMESGKATIIRETIDETGRFKLVRCSPSDFHLRYASNKVDQGEKKIAATKIWIAHPKRRTYDDVVFAPGMTVPKRFYNLWNGFDVEPLGKDEKPTKEMEKGVKLFLEHLEENVCQGDTEQVNWLKSYFAHLFQKPYEKPLVAPVFRGRKGVGKDTLVNQVGRLIYQYYFMAADPRYLVGNFNAHLENLLLLVLNEAFWSADHKVDGILKDLVTGETHNIERKGKEVAKFRNYTRVVIMGNESWLVPASEDERRFAVFTVGEKKRGNLKFFSQIRKNLENGGDRYLLRYFLDYEINAEINFAPQTSGLTDQKVESLNPFYQWWRECLFEEQIVGIPFPESKWPKFISNKEIRDGYSGYCGSHRIRSRQLQFPKMHSLFSRVIGENSSKSYVGGTQMRGFKVPPLKEARKRWEKSMGVTEDWIDDDISEEELGL